MSATTSAPHPRIAELLAELEHSRRDLLDVVGSLSPEQRDAAPAGPEWSVAQILEHLCMVEDGGGRVVSKLMKQAQEKGAYESEASSVLGSLDAFDIDNTNRRIEAPDVVRPTGGMTAAQSLERLGAMRERLVTALLQGSGLALTSVSHPHPIFGPLDGYQWILLISLHQRRHIAQIRRQTTRPEA
jgi:hypothetical protein